jgi:nitrogen-specific signal transduction histidine kinase
VLFVARDITDLHDAIAERGRLDGSIKTARAIAHELGNHLAVLSVNGEMLADSATEEDADLASQVTRATRRTRDTLDRLQRIVRFEEIDGGGGPLLDLDAATRP